MEDCGLGCIEGETGCLAGGKAGVGVVSVVPYSQLMGKLGSPSVRAA